MKLTEEEIRQRAIKAIEAIRARVEASDEPEMTLEDINEEIRLAREERKKHLSPLQQKH